MCLFTKYIENPKYKPNKKNGYNPPKCTDERLRFIPAKCGRCIECRKQKKREWLMRLSEEIKEDSKAIFVTLTFSDINLKKLSMKLLNKQSCTNNEEEHIITTFAIRRFLELIRKFTGKSVKHWFVTEKGEDFGRIHLHGIMWCERKLVEHWKYGYTYLGKFVNETTINYITKYMLKKNEKFPNFIGKVYASAGIGKGYIKEAYRNKYKGKETNECYITRTGIRIALPEYFRNKIYSEKERELLWIDKQDRGYRYINGEKVSTEDLEAWENMLKYYQDRARKIYGDNTEEWEMEKEKRKLAKRNEWMRKQRKKLASQASQAH